MHMKSFLIQIKDGSMINKVTRELKETNKVEAVRKWIWTIFSHHSSAEVEEGVEDQVVDSNSISVVKVGMVVVSNRGKKKYLTSSEIQMLFS